MLYVIVYRVENFFVILLYRGLEVSHMDIKNNQEIITLKKKSLKRYRKNQACINRLREKLFTLTKKIESAKSSTLSGMPRGGKPVTMDDLISDKMILEGRIKRLEKKQDVYKNQILDEIDLLDDPRYCEVLEGYFIDCLTLDEIAEKEGYSVRHTYKLYSDAISLLAQIEQ